MNDFANKLKVAAGKSQTTQTPVQQIKPIDNKNDRTTIDMPIDLKRRVKMICSRNNMFLRNFIIEAIEAKLKDY